MSFEVLTTQAAEDDLAGLISMLATESPITIDKVYSELIEIKQQLATYPYAYQALSNTQLRRAVLRSCRFVLYFRIHLQHVQILAILPQMLGKVSLLKRGLEK